MVQVAKLVAYRGTDHCWGRLVWDQVPATLTVGVEERDVEDLKGYAGLRVAELRRLLGPLDRGSGRLVSRQISA